VAEVVVMGAGVVGLTTAMLLSKDGHEVVVVERDQAQPDGDQDALWADWERRGVNQFRLLHYFQPRFRAGLERELPAVVDALDAAGALRHNVMALVPAELSGGFRDDDAQFETLTARRPVMEAVLARTAAAMPGVDIRRGVAIEGLVPGTPNEPDVPHVVGVRTADGEEINADLIVDTLGRRSPLAGWLPAIDARPPVEEREDCGFVYYGRHFRSPDGTIPRALANPLQTYDSIGLITLPADHGTWSVVITTSARDKALRVLRDPARWHATLSRYPLAAHWADGEPISGVDVMAGIEDRYRRLVVDGVPVATGVVVVGDAWACTNPSLGRGASIGLTHARLLRDLLRENDTADHDKISRRFDELTTTVVEPIYRATVWYDRHRLAEVDSDVAGAPYRPDDQRWTMNKALFAASLADPGLARDLASIGGLLATPDQVFSRPGVVQRVLELGAAAPQYPLPGPSRADLLAATA
jgi:2-polyprenyl-6-methoxyphenol hydroxylase-like FAD-dependent oxidoreductase